MKGKEIVLLILIIVAGVIFYYGQTGKFHFGLNWEDDFFFTGEEYTYEETQVVEPPLAARLQLTNAHGDVEFQGTDEERVTITLQKKIWRRTEEQAKEVSDRLHMTINKGDLLLKVSTNRTDFKRRNFETHFRLRLPKSMAVEVENSHGTAKIAQVKSVSLVNSHGKVSISDIAGDVTAENSYEDVEVENIRGNCQVDSRHSSVFVSDVQGKAKIDHAYGNIRLESISQPVEVRSSHSQLYGQGLAAGVDSEGSYEKLTLIDVGPSKIWGHHWDVEVEDARDNLYIKNSYAVVRVSDLKGNLTVDGRNVEIFANKVVANEIQLTSSYENIELAEFSGKTTISLAHGGLILKPMALTQPIEVRDVYSDITLYWPAQDRYPFEGQVRGGSIDWTLLEKPDSRHENGLTTLRAFGSERDKPSILLSTTYGDIRIER